MNEIIKVIDVTKIYKNNRGIQNISMSMERGEIHVLLGANGAGKSTLMKAIAGLLLPDSGRIVYCVGDNCTEGLDRAFCRKNSGRCHGIGIDNACVMAGKHYSRAGASLQGRMAAVGGVLRYPGCRIPSAHTDGYRLCGYGDTVRKKQQRSLFIDGRSCADHENDPDPGRRPLLLPARELAGLRRKYYQCPCSQFALFHCVDAAVDRFFRRDRAASL